MTYTCSPKGKGMDFEAGNQDEESSAQSIPQFRNRSNKLEPSKAWRIEIFAGVAAQDKAQAGY